MMLLLAALFACVTDAELTQTVDEAACQWVDRCTDRYPSVEACLAENTSPVQPGCTINVDTYGICVELIDLATCPSGDLFEPPAACEEMWLCESEA